MKLIYLWCVKKDLAVIPQSLLIFLFSIIRQHPQLFTIHSSLFILHYIVAFKSHEGGWQSHTDDMNANNYFHIKP